MLSDLAHDLLQRQRALIAEWLASESAASTAKRYLRWRGLDDDPNEVCNEAWVRITAALDRRGAPLPDVATVDDAAAYAARTIDNLIRDRRRRLARRGDARVDDIPELVLTTGDDGPETRVVDRVLLEQLIEVLGRRAAAPPSCAGCPGAVVIATALEVVHMVLAGDEGGDRGRAWIDRLIHTALERTDAHVPASDRAQSQRKSRCGRCVVDVLSDALREVLGDGR
jgi:DNA-directed RNA polymerase specialized sigma24 family protein